MTRLLGLCHRYASLSVITPPTRALDGFSVSERAARMRRVSSFDDSRQPCSTPVFGKRFSSFR